MNAATKSEVLLALQTLLEARFSLRIERQTRALGVYVLTVGKGGIQRQPLDGGGCPAAEGDKPAAPPMRGQPPCGRVMMMFSPTRSRLEARNISIADLIDRLSNFVDRPIIDKTGYSGTLDLKLEFAPERFPFGFMGSSPMPGETPLQEQEAAISLFTAVREQLGLRLESGKGPTAVIVIRHVDRPSAN